MVLDIRHLRFAERVSDTPDAPLPSASVVEGLDPLLECAARAATPGEQARALAQLRQLIPSAAGMARLCEILEAEGDPRRLVAAQMIGYHRPWLSSRARVRRILALARRERDGAVASALVWCLRQRDEIGEFLLSERADVAREAALGLPLHRPTLSHLLKALLAGPRPEIERVLLGKLRNIHPSLVRELVDLLFEREWADGAHQLISLFECLPQRPLFEIFLEERSRSGWDPEEETVRSRSWSQLGEAARQVLERNPSLGLLRYLFSRSGEDEAFARRHARFLRAVLHSTDVDLSADLLEHLERLTFGASEDKVARLAQLLVELSDRLEGEEGVQAASLLETWKSRSAALKLKIYHLQQGLV